MRSMISVLVFFTFIAMVASATTMMMMSTTHKPHHSTREPSESGSLSFFFDHTSAQAMHMMTSSTHMAMSGADHAHVSRYVYGRLCPNEHLIKLVQ